MNNDIQESYCSFDVSRLLRDKGFKKPTLCYYFEDGEFRENVLRDTVGMDYGAEYTVEFSELLEDWNDGWITKKNGDRCFGCSKDRGYFDTYSAPTHAVAIEWIRVNFGVWIQGAFPINNGTWEWVVFFLDKPIEGTDSYRNVMSISTDKRSYSSPKEAIDAALLYILQNFIP